MGYKAWFGTLYNYHRLPMYPQVSVVWLCLYGMSFVLPTPNIHVYMPGVHVYMCQEHTCTGTCTHVYVYVFVLFGYGGLGLGFLSSLPLWLT